MFPSNLESIFGALGVGALSLLALMALYWLATAAHVGFFAWLPARHAAIRGPLGGAVLVLLIYCLGITTQDFTDELTDSDPAYDSVLSDLAYTMLGRESEHRFSTLFKEADGGRELRPVGREIFAHLDHWRTIVLSPARAWDDRAWVAAFLDDPEGALASSATIADPATRTGHAQDVVNAIYYDAKNWCYSQDNYFDELERIQRRIDFARSSFMVALVGTLAALFLSCVMLIRPARRLATGISRVLTRGPAATGATVVAAGTLGLSGMLWVLGTGLSITALAVAGLLAIGLAGALRTARVLDLYPEHEPAAGRHHAVVTVLGALLCALTAFGFRHAENVYNERAFGYRTSFLSRSAPATAAAAASFDDVSLPRLPSWTDKYEDDNLGDFRFFDIDGVRDRFALSRRAAVELQNAYRDATRRLEVEARATGDAPPWQPDGRQLERAFTDSLIAARQFPEGIRDATALDDAGFVLVLDLDATMYDQYGREAGKCPDRVSVADGEGGHRWVALAPGWRELFEGVSRLGGCVVLFSANADELTWANVRAWLELAPESTTLPPPVVGVLTNSYLTLQSKERGDPVVVPSKDLRILDEHLAKAVIVDDNPIPLIQYPQIRNIRTIPKFRSSAYVAALQARDPTGDRRRQAIEGTLPAVLAELEDAVEWQRERKDDGVTFRRAYLPYTVSGQLAVRALVASGLSGAEAIAFVREHPDVAQSEF